MKFSLRDSMAKSALGDEGRSLLEDIKLMHSDSAFEDMVFLCGAEEEEVGACRMVVAARSPVLKSMLLTSGMAESKLHRVPLPSITPATMRICLEFFYTDTVHESSWPLSILPAMRVLEAAIFFLLKPLERLALAYMHNFSSPILKGECSEQSFELIQAYNLGVDLLSAQQNQLHNMTSVLDMLRRGIHLGMKSDTMQERLVYKNLSQLALAHFSQIHLLDIEWALCAYFSFVHLLKWTAYRLVSTDSSINEDELGDVLDICFPVSLHQISLATNTNINSADANISRVMKLIRDPLAQCLQTISVDFANIPTDILCKIIEPRDVIPPSTLLRAYKCQAFYRPEFLWDQLCHGEDYYIEADDLTVIACRGWGSQGFARCNTHLNASNMTCFDWRIVMLSPCTNFRVGLCLWDPSFTVSDCNMHMLGDMTGSWALGSDGFLHHTNLENEQCCAAYADAFHDKEGVAIEVHVDMVNLSCSFSIDGKKRKVAWENLSIGFCLLYPAISMQMPGKARLEMAYPDWMDCPTMGALSLN